MRRILFLLMLPLALAACGAEPVWAPEEEVQRALYRHNGPPSITLVTVVSNKNGSGGHSALLVNGSHRAIFDPAGTFQHPALPERNDVIYGMSEKAYQFYKEYHARVTWHVVSQEVQVPPEVAEAALRKIQAYGAVPKAYCAVATTSVLSELPGFEGVPTGFSPIAVMKYFDTLPSVEKDVFRDNSPANNDYIRAPAVL
ncbi:hypothetical protein P1J78_09880 [Psychromarinibacter sp. C21-152]|uniref:Lipoprotein n=1 Tax=Psychromarinibacter sediminicola TaxID=3033385 RepID=A0AAE3NN64_9RHOB|nr:hypothetical protein [Psychromarinibacter sediminicola]MDF0601038.1 hypothetical protein [Psychromarinibacter sediminicola]